LEKGKYEPFYVNTSVEVCPFMKKLKEQPIVQIILADIAKSTNLPFSCPLKKVTLDFQNEIKIHTHLLSFSGRILSKKLGYSN
jgi:hypothetical protein